MSERSPDRRVQRTRQRLREALVALMLAKSYEKITVQDIIDHANVGRATFYNHYEDKDDLLLRGVAGLALRPEDENGDARGPVPAQTDDLDFMSTSAMFRHSRQNSRVQQVMFKRSRENPILEKVTTFLYETMEERLRRLRTAGHGPGVPDEIAAHFLTGGLLALMRWWHDREFPYSPEEMDVFFQQLVLPGLLGPPNDRTR